MSQQGTTTTGTAPTQFETKEKEFKSKQGGQNLGVHNFQKFKTKKQDEMFEVCAFCGRSKEDITDSKQLQYCQANNEIEKSKNNKVCHDFVLVEDEPTAPLICRSCGLKRDDVLLSPNQKDIKMCSGKVENEKGINLVKKGLQMSQKETI